MPVFAEPWVDIDDDTASSLEKQLRVEVGEGHPLWRAPVRAIAQRVDQDDVLFQLVDGRVAEVHLTWRGSAETDPLWPNTVFYETLNDWRSATAIA